MKDQKDLAFSFLNTVLTQHESEIITEIENSNNHISSLSQGTKMVLIRIVEILAEKKVKNNTLTIVDFVSRNYFPVDECLAVCEEKNQTEACAVLYRRKG